VVLGAASGFPFDGRFATYTNRLAPQRLCVGRRRLGGGYACGMRQQVTHQRLVPESVSVFRNVTPYRCIEIHNTIGQEHSKNRGSDAFGKRVQHVHG